MEIMYTCEPVYMLLFQWILISILILWAHYKLYEFALIFLTLTNVYVCYYKGITTTTCSATFFSSDIALAHTFLYGPVFSICCTSLLSSCLCQLNNQDNVPQANMAYLIRDCGLAINCFVEGY